MGSVTEAATRLGYSEVTSQLDDVLTQSLGMLEICNSAAKRALMTEQFLPTCINLKETIRINTSYTAILKIPQLEPDAITFLHQLASFGFRV